MLLHDQKDELKELFPHIWKRLLTIRILKEVFQADKEKVCTMYYGVYLFADGHVYLVSFDSICKELKRGIIMLNLIVSTYLLALEVGEISF